MDESSQKAPARIPLVDLGAQHRALAGEIREALERVIASNRFILGPEVEAFEKEYAAWLGVRRVVGVASGTDALRLALWALGIGAGDEVILPAMTFAATAESAAVLGARPVFADVEVAGMNLDPASVEAAFTSRTRAVVAVHLHGLPAATEALGELCARHGAALVEDAAQAHGSERGGRKAGTLGRIAAFSFFPGKTLGCLGDGGAVATDDEALAEEVRRLRDHGRSSKHVHARVGANARLDALQAAVLRVKLKRLEEWVVARRRCVATYRRLLADVDALHLPPDPPDLRPAWHLFVVRTAGPEVRERLIAHLAARGIDAGVHYPVPLHLQPAFASPDRPEGSLPEAERAAREVLSLPLYPELTEVDLGRVAGAVREFYGV